ncbi:MAG: deoxyribose-phosphate aldolase [Bdellovibrionales bacterium]
MKFQSGSSSSTSDSQVEGLVEHLAKEVMKKLGGSTPAVEEKSTAPEGAINLQPSQLAGYIDHTLLKPDATADQIRTLCEEAAQYHFATVCVNSSNVRLAAELLKNSTVKPIAVVGFPLGASTPKAKAFETLEAIRNGAQEIDTVVNIGALKSKDYKTVGDDIRAVVEAAGSIPVKVILETSQLNDEEKIIACALSVAGGAAFVKTSTGFAGGGATEEDIRLMRRVVGPNVGVKASGGVRDLETAKKMLAAGANRLGTSSSVAIVTGAAPSQKGY